MEEFAYLRKRYWERHFGLASVNVLMIGIAHGSIALPISWTLLSYRGESGAEEHFDLLGRSLEMVGPEQIRMLVADRELARGACFAG